MADFWKIVVSRNGEEYELALSWDTESFEKGEPTVSVRATRRVEGEEESLEASVSIRADDDERPALALIVNNEVVFTVPLSDLFTADQFIELIPGWVYGVGNPIVGCLVRAGLSTSVAQILVCRRDTVEVSWFWPRTRAIGTCLRHHLGDMGLEAARRALRCFLRIGF